ncbi:hypothetical protein E4T56_gene1906, partial [Termitomyces sp. T112]
ISPEDAKALTPEQLAFRQSVARGARVFRDKMFLITDTAGINSRIGFGNPVRNSCVFCHNMSQMGNDVAPGQVDLGTTTMPFADPWRDLPLFRITCLKAPHPHYGRVIYTMDPGFAMTTGRCADVGKITLQSMRGLAARAPYFSNGKAGSHQYDECAVMFRFFLTAAALAAPLSAVAAQTGDVVRFIACPIYRDADSGKKSGCWLSDDPATGLRSDVSLSPHKPDWNYAVMVEGVVSAAPPTPCGGTVLDAVRTSRLYNTPCTRHMLPAEGFAGRRFVLPKRNITPSSVARPVPPGPYAERVFPVYFEFGNDFLVYQYGDYLIEQASNWIA